MEKCRGAESAQVLLVKYECWRNIAIQKGGVFVII